MLPKIIAGFITEEERAEMLQWALKQRPLLRPNGAGRGSRQLDVLPQIPVQFETVRQRIIRTLGIEGALEELKTPAPRYRSYLSVLDAGTELYRHLDIVPAGHDYLRCNVFLSLPETGGMPVVEDQVYPLQAGDLLYFTPDKHLHSCEPVGKGVRVVASFGFLVPNGGKIEETPAGCKLCGAVRNYARMLVGKFR